MSPTNPTNSSRARNSPTDRPFSTGCYAGPGAAARSGTHKIAGARPVSKSRFGVEFGHSLNRRADGEVAPTAIICRRYFRLAARRAPGPPGFLVFRAIADYFHPTDRKHEISDRCQRTHLPVMRSRPSTVRIAGCLRDSDGV